MRLPFFSVCIDAAFKAQIPPLSVEEREQLESNIVAHGCRDPLTVWNGVLLDGRHDGGEKKPPRRAALIAVEGGGKDHLGLAKGSNSALSSRISPSNTNPASAASTLRRSASSSAQSAMRFNASTAFSTGPSCAR